MIPTDRLDKDVSLYIHIPFCTRKCHYCHFFVLPDKELFKDQLLSGLLVEWEKIRPLLTGKKVVSVYFGGGTPYLFGPQRLGRLLSEIAPPEDCEITLEANPENVTPETMKAYAAMRINRVSLGIQTLDAPLLHTLGRLHNPETALKAVYDTADSGIDNISIDLMYDLPGQTVTSWKNTLQEAIKLPIRHLSLYNLTIEPHTLFFKYRDKIAKQVPSDEDSLEMLLLAESILEAAGLQRYEISAFAQPGSYSKHNSGYWTGRPFIGLGPSAFSYWEGQRYRNIAHLGRYVDLLNKGESPVDFSEQLESPERERELVAIRLRLMQGIETNDPLLDVETRKKLEELSRENPPFICKNQGYFQLTDKGKLFYDRVATEII